MFVEIDANGRVSLRDADNFAAFKVLTLTTDCELIDRAIQSIGHCEGNFAWISRDWLLTTIKGDDALWREKLDSMIEYAMKKGWFNPGRNSIRAHIEVPEI